MDRDTLMKTLHAMAEPSYAAFAASLLPGSAPVLGVRLPALRKLAASLVKSYGAAALSFPGDSYFEEVMLRGMMTGLLVKEPSDWPCVLSFLPSVSDWSVCDSFCSSFPAVKRSPEPFFPLVYALRNEKAPFTARFSLVMMLRYYLTEGHLAQVLSHVETCRREEYYVQMAAAWTLAEAFALFPERTLHTLRRLQEQSSPIAALAVRKICESKKITPEQKAQVRQERGET